MIEVTFEGITFHLREETPGQWSGARTRNRKAFRADAFNDETGATVYGGSTWRASDGRWYPGNINTSRKEGPGHETPEACIYEQLTWSAQRADREARGHARGLLIHTDRVNGFRAVLGWDLLTVDGLLADAREEKTR